MTNVADGTNASWSPERSAAGGHNPYLIAFVVSIATFMEVLDTTIANVALRHIAGGLAVGIDESTYVITSYLVANAIVLSISGWLSTVIGRKRFYMICVATFAFASLLCGFAWSLESLVLFRRRSVPDFARTQSEPIDLSLVSRYSPLPSLVATRFTVSSSNCANGRGV
jgi:MFS transporter, DHA2 family, multidrug resistance protein